MGQRLTPCLRRAWPARSVAPWLSHWLVISTTGIAPVVDRRGRPSSRLISPWTTSTLAVANTQLSERLHRQSGAADIAPGEHFRAPRGWAEKVYPTSLTSTKPPRAVTSRPGKNRNSFLRSFARRSDHFANHS